MQYRTHFDVELLLFFSFITLYKVATLITLLEFRQIRISTKYDICRFLIFHEDVLRFFLLFVIFFFYDEFTVREVDIFRRLRSYSR